jgi:hypothetical protein
MTGRLASAITIDLSDLAVKVGERIKANSGVQWTEPEGEKLAGRARMATRRAKPVDQLRAFSIA